MQQEENEARYISNHKNGEGMSTQRRNGPRQNIKNMVSMSSEDRTLPRDRELE